LLPQFRQPIKPSAEDVSVGISRVLQGLFMKMVLAEILASGWSAGAGVNAAFDRTNGPWGGLDVWVVVIAFGFQLFFDFAGYSHIVIGAARLLGITLEENFDRPFLSPTPAAFWNRWHMSLSFWIRDFVFLQIASLRRGRSWVYLSLLLSMVVCGLWHEATATFIVWGTYHGLLLVAHRVGQQMKRSLGYHVPPKLGLAASSVSTFCLVSVGWLFFRARSMTQALKMAGALFAVGSYAHLALPISFYVLTAATVLGWGLFQVAEVLLERWQEAYEQRVHMIAEPSMSRTTALAGDLPLVAFEIVSFGRAKRWWWLAPIVIVFGTFVGLAINDLRPAPPTTPFMYTLF
jgi:alginate O-acetyltransferase complex protein AlgI